jgi:hypothetical protein
VIVLKLYTHEMNRISLFLYTEKEGYPEDVPTISG